MNQVCRKFIIVGRYREYEDCLLSSLDIKATGLKANFGVEALWQQQCIFKKRTV